MAKNKAMNEDFEVIKKQPETIRKFSKAGCTVMIQDYVAMAYGLTDAYTALTGKMAMELSPNELRALADFLEA